MLLGLIGVYAIKAIIKALGLGLELGAYRRAFRGRIGIPYIIKRNPEPSTVLVTHGWYSSTLGLARHKIIVNCHWSIL